jgi:hypothetical protein
MLYRTATMSRAEWRRASATANEKPGAKAGEAGEAAPSATADGAPARREGLGVPDPRALTSAYLRGIACVGVGIIWVFALDAGLNPIRGQAESVRISEASERVTAGTPNVLAFVEASEISIAGHSPLDAGLYGALGDFARKAAMQARDPMRRLRFMDIALKLHTKAAAAEPVNADRPYELARDYAIFQRPALAAQQADLACELLPNDPWIRAYLADQFLRYRYLDLAQHYLDSAQELAARRNIETVKELIAGIRDEMGKVGMLKPGPGRSPTAN